MSVIILFRTLTQAQRAVYMLRAAGIPSTVVKAPSETTDRGCTYAAGFARRSYFRALRLLDDNNVTHGRVFFRGEDGVYRETAP